MTERLTKEERATASRIARQILAGTVDYEDATRQHCRTIVRWADTCDALEAERDKYRVALTAINDIRNSIVGVQTVNFSLHVYPLVRALNAAGFEGQPYVEAAEEQGTLLERVNLLRDELARFKAPLEICAACDEQRQDHPVHRMPGPRASPRGRCDFTPSGNFADPSDLLP